MDLHRGRFDLVVLGMGAQEADIDAITIVFHSHDEAVLVPADIEDDAVVRDKVSGPVTSADVGWAHPGCALDLLMPRLQRLFCIGVVLPKSLKCCSVEDPQVPLASL
jgi:hypothetical protein